MVGTHVIAIYLIQKFAISPYACQKATIVEYSGRFVAELYVMLDGEELMLHETALTKTRTDFVILICSLLTIYEI